MTDNKNVLQKADELTAGSRHEDYGTVLPEAERFAQCVQAVTGLPCKPEHYGLIMLCLKLVREGYRHKHDNIVDLAGYARVQEMYWDEADEVADLREQIAEDQPEFVRLGSTRTVPCEWQPAYMEKK